MPHPFGLHPHSFFIGARQYNQEFLAAVAPDGVVTPNGFLHSPRALLQRNIAREVAVGVVDALEVVQVSYDDTDRQLFSFRSSQFPVENIQN